MAETTKPTATDYTMPIYAGLALAAAGLAAYIMQKRRNKPAPSANNDNLKSYQRAVVRSEVRNGTQANQTLYNPQRSLPDHIVKATVNTPIWVAPGDTMEFEDIPSQAISEIVVPYKLRQPSGHLNGHDNGHLNGHAAQNGAVRVQPKDTRRQP